MRGFRLILCILLALACAKAAFFIMRVVFSLAIAAVFGMLQLVIFGALFLMFFGVIAGLFHLRERGKASND